MSYTVKTKVTLSWEISDNPLLKLNEGTESYNYVNKFETIIEAFENVSEQMQKIIDVQTPREMKRPHLP